MIIDAPDLMEVVARVTELRSVQSRFAEFLRRYYHLSGCVTADLCQLAADLGESPTAIDEARDRLWEVEVQDEDVAAARLEQFVRYRPYTKGLAHNLETMWYIYSAIEFTPGACVADLGAGLGQMAHFIAADGRVSGSTVYCVDRSPGQIQLARRLGWRIPKSAYVEYLQARSSMVPLSSGSIQVALHVSHLHFLNRTWRDSLEETARLMGPESQLLVVYYRTPSVLVNLEPEVVVDALEAFGVRAFALPIGCPHYQTVLVRGSKGERFRSRSVVLPPVMGD